jgi:hypothetical protein
VNRVSASGKELSGLRVARIEKSASALREWSARAQRQTKEPLMADKKPAAPQSKKSAVSHPGMMGDGTEEQNLGERGDPSARIKKKDVEAAFGKKAPKK